MNTLENHEVFRWAEQRGIVFDRNGRSGFLTTSRSCVLIRPPTDFTRVAFLSYSLLTLLSQNEDEFGGAVLWLQEFDTEDAPINRVAGAVWRDLRAANGERRPLRETHGHLFGRNELWEASAFTFLALGFHWNLYLLPESGEFFIYKHHDEAIYVVGRTEDITQRLLHDLEPGAWTPRRQECPWYLLPARAEGSAAL